MEDARAPGSSYRHGSPTRIRRRPRAAYAAAAHRQPATGRGPRADTASPFRQPIGCIDAAGSAVAAARSRRPSAYLGVRASRPRRRRRWRIAPPRGRDNPSPQAIRSAVRGRLRGGVDAPSTAATAVCADLITPGLTALRRPHAANAALGRSGVFGGLPFGQA